MGAELVEGVVGLTTTGFKENKHAKDMPSVPVLKPDEPTKVLLVGCIIVDLGNNIEVPEPTGTVGFGIDTLRYGGVDLPVMGVRASSMISAMLSMNRP